MSLRQRFPMCVGQQRKEWTVWRGFSISTSFATPSPNNLLSYGAAPKDVQELLGHSDVTTTMNIYAHASKEAKRDAAKLLDKVQ